MVKLNYITNLTLAIMATLFGFGNAIRCLSIHYDYLGDKIFYTVMMALIGCVGLWLIGVAREEYKNEKE